MKNRPPQNKETVARGGFLRQLMFLVFKVRRSSLGTDSRFCPGGEALADTKLTEEDYTSNQGLGNNKASPC